MERRTGIIIVTTIGIILIGLGVMAFLAWRTSNEILEEFQRVNSGLDTTRLPLGDRRFGNSGHPNSFVCAEMLVKADSVHRAYTNLIAQVDSFKLSLVLVDRFNTTAADSVFQAHEQGANLYKAFLDFFDLAERTCTNDSLDAGIDQHAHVVRDAATVEEWRAANFHRVPAIACITLLSKFQWDAVNAETLVMKDMVARCEPATKK